MFLCAFFLAGIVCLVLMLDPDPTSLVLCYVFLATVASHSSALSSPFFIFFSSFFLKKIPIICFNVSSYNTVGEVA